MVLKLESRDGLLLTTVTGRVSFVEALKCWKTVCDAAAERACGKILFDRLGAKGEISDLEKYEVSKIIVDYWAHTSMSPTVAVVGKPPTITGFGALVASNRGVNDPDVLGTPSSAGVAKRIFKNRRSVRFRIFD
jgi:hypothetical protein